MQGPGGPFQKVMSDAEKYYLSQGGSQDKIDSYYSQPNLQPSKFASDLNSWYTDPNRTDTNDVNTLPTDGRTMGDVNAANRQGNIGSYIDQNLGPNGISNSITPVESAVNYGPSSTMLLRPDEQAAQDNLNAQKTPELPAPVTPNPGFQPQGMGNNPGAMAAAQNVPGTNLKTTSGRGNNYQGMYSHEQAWEEPVHVDRQGNYLYASGYGAGTPVYGADGRLQSVPTIRNDSKAPSSFTPNKMKPQVSKGVMQPTPITPPVPIQPILTQPALNPAITPPPGGYQVPGTSLLDNPNRTAERARQNAQIGQQSATEPFNSGFNS